jgi:hypothetical protein
MNFLLHKYRKWLPRYAAIIGISLLNSAAYTENNLLKNTPCKYYGILNAPPEATNNVARFIVERKLYEEPPHNPLFGLRIFDFATNELPYAIREGSIFATNTFSDKDIFQRKINKKTECILKTHPYPIKSLKLKINQTNCLWLNYELYGRSSYNNGWSQITKGKIMPVSTNDGCWYEIEAAFEKRYPHYRLMLSLTNTASFVAISEVVFEFMDYEVLFPNNGNTSCLAFFCGTKGIEPSYQTIQRIADISPEKTDLWSMQNLQQNKDFLETLKDKSLWQSPGGLFRLGLVFAAFILAWLLIRTKRFVSQMEKKLR